MTVSRLQKFIERHNICRLWIITLILVLTIIGVGLIWFTHNNTDEELTSIENQIDPNVVESGFTPDDLKIPDTAEKATTGIYLIVLNRYLKKIIVGQ